MSARGLNVFVSIGAKLLPSLNSAALATERRFGLMSRRMRLTAAAMSASWKGMERNFSTFSTHIAMPAGILAGLGGRAVYEWSKVGNELQAVTQMSDRARKSIEAVARSMPGNPAQNLSAALDLARTGFDEKQIMGTLKITLKLGRADSSVDQAEAADILTNVMKGMKLGDGSLEEVSRNANRVANNIAFAAAKSSSDVRLMGESFKYAAPLAARLGIPIEDLSAYFMTMANAGIKGSESGVAFRSGMVRLLKPTKDASAVLAKHNMSLADYVKTSQKASGQSIVNQLRAGGVDASGAKGEIDRLLASDISGAALTQKITEAVANGMEGGADATDLDNLSEAVTQALFSGVDKVDFKRFLEDASKKFSTSDIVHFFDVRQGARLSTLFGPDWQRNLNALKAMGNIAAGKGTFLDKMYEMQLKGAVEPWLRIQQSFGNLFIAMAESGVMSTVANAMDKIASGIMALSKTNPALLRFATYALLGVAALGPLGFALAGIGAAFRILWPAFRLFGRLLFWVGGLAVRFAPMLLNGLARLAPWIIRGLVMAFGLLSNPVGWAIILAGVAAALIWYFRDDLAKAWPKVVAWFKGAWNGLKTWLLSINWGGIGMTIANALTGGLAGKFAAFMGRMRASVASVGQTGMNSPRGGLAGARAKGGPVRRGSAYLVGEEGPELFTAGRSGNVLPFGRTAAVLGAAGAAMAPMAAAATPVSVTINVNGASDPHAIAREVDRQLRLTLRQVGGDNGRFLND